MTNHAMDLFVEWHEKSIGERKRIEIDRHLQECGECASYYARMSAVLDDPSLLRIHRLDPDPYLAAKIRSVHREGRTSLSASVRRRAFRWPVIAAGFTLALAIGAFLGRGLSKTSSQTSESLTNQYYQAISQNGFGDRWTTGLTNSEGNSK